LGLIGMAKGNGKLVIKTTTAAIPPKIVFHIEYTPPDRPPIGSLDAPFNDADSPKKLPSGEDPPELPRGQDPEEPGTGGRDLGCRQPSPEVPGGLPEGTRDEAMADYRGGKTVSAEDLQALVGSKIREARGGSVAGLMVGDVN
jgi:hypothetical protein